MTLLSTTGASAHSEEEHRPTIDVLQVSGLIDPILAEAIEAQLVDSIHDGSAAVIFQVSSPGAVIGDAQMMDLLAKISSAPIPTGVWIGSSASASDNAALLLLAVDLGGVAPGGHVQLPDEKRLNSEQALAAGVTATDAPTLGDFALAMIDEDLISEDLALIVRDGHLPRRELQADVRFHKVPLFNGFLHSVASPQMTYLFLLAGLALLLLEFFTAGVGVAGLTGVTCLLLSSYGLGVLPMRPWALVVILVATLAFGVDIQAGVPRFWTGVGTLALLIGSANLFVGIGNSWISLVAGISGFMLTMLVALPSLVRSRFSTSTIGREWMIGEMGEVVSEVAPSGVVRVKDALWQANTNRATPVSVGDVIRVTGIEGIYLQVEPEVGGARDYREMRGDRS